MREQPDILAHLRAALLDATVNGLFDTATRIRLGRAAMVEFTAARRVWNARPGSATQTHAQTSFMGIDVVEDLRMPDDIGIVERGRAGFRLFHPSSGRFVGPWMRVHDIPHANKLIVESIEDAPVAIEIGHFIRPT